MASRRLVSLVFVFAIAGVSTAGIADFDDLSLAAESYWNGSDGSGGFTSGSANFNNYYDPAWGLWAGFAYSNIKDGFAQGWGSQYNAITGDAQSGDNYAVGYFDTYNQITPTMVLDTEQVLTGMYVTNNNYAYYSMLNGDAFAKKFGGETGNDPDWFLLTITGMNASGQTTGTVDFYLADYRFADNSLDYIVNTWEFVDTSGLGAVKSLEFTLSSSDVGSWGMNTPAYFVMDTVAQELTALMLAVQNIENAIAGKTEALKAINTALAKERIAIKALNALLAGGELDDLRPVDIYKAKRRIRLGMIRQKAAKRAVRKSIDKLEDALAILTGGSGQKNCPSDEEDDEKFNGESELRTADINGDGVINILDFAILTKHWLKEYEIEE